MRFFESYGHPSDDNTMGDIHLQQYIFLGDFCDRGNYSLEVIFLLLALKVRYPDHIFIVRGHHEDININTVHGLGEECEKRLDENIRQENSIFMKLNALFDLLPLAVLIDGKILCVHGGIGSTITKLLDISTIKRPAQVVQDVRTHDQQILLDLLWSEYSDDINEVAINEERDISKSGFILKYGKDRVNKFLQDNGLSMLITSHQLINEGIKSYNNDKVLIVYSASNYMDKYNNHGGMVNITKNSAFLHPKLIEVYKSEKKNYRPSKNISPVRFKYTK
jgi:diadenosine tetraphosphatase ApaH/serine/threonine PP2A family protein phosphatase